MILEAANKYNVDPRLMVAMLQNESAFGTLGAAVRTHNPANVGNEDGGKLTDFKTWPAGVQALARELSARKVAPASTAVSQSTSPIIQSWVDQIAKGSTSISNVPEKIRNQVIAELDRQNVKPPTSQATADQRTTASYAVRMEQAAPTLNDLEPAIAKMNYFSFAAQSKLPAAFQSKTMQQYSQAARNFINATLRRESGAAISASEFREAYAQYLPQPGDTPAVLAQKKTNRDLVAASFRSSAGPAYQSADQLLGSKVRVRLSTGQTGTIDSKDFDPKTMTKL
jgi:hypothetical protein